VRRGGSTIIKGVLSGLMLGNAILLGGCGGSSSTGAGVSVKTEEEARFKTLRKLGDSNTKQALSEMKKKAAAERKEKSSSNSTSP
jgi:hypothetical protein